MQAQESRWLIRIAVRVVLVAVLCGCAAPQAPSATATPVPTATPIPVATATGTATPAPTATPIPVATATGTATPAPTATPIPVATATGTATPAPTATPIPVATATGTATATLAPTLANTPIPKAVASPQPTASGIVASIQKYDYAQWGRPEGMDTPGKPCGNFNNQRAVRKLTASLHVENKSGQDMTDWYVLFVRNTGSPAYACFMGYAGALNTIPAGQGRDVTFTAYMETHEAIAFGVIVDATVGSSNRLPFP